MRLDLSVYVAIKGRDTFGIKRNILLYDGRYLYFGGCCRDNRFLLATSSRQRESKDQDEDAFASPKS
jgi:hypothetical protein